MGGRHRPAARRGTRVVLMRFGIALSPNGGALAKLLPPFKMGGGGKLGNGKHYVSWIALPYLVEAILFLLHPPELKGPVNLTAPEPVTNAEMAETLGDMLNRPAKVTVPAFALRVMFGDVADGALFASQRVAPRRLSDEGFVFRYPQIKVALQAVLNE